MNSPDSLLPVAPAQGPFDERMLRVCHLIGRLYANIHKRERLTMENAMTLVELHEEAFKLQLILESNAKAREPVQPPVTLDQLLHNSGCLE